MGKTTYAVVLVNYRSEDYLRRAIASIIAAAQVPDFRVIAVDNSATQIPSIETQIGNDPRISVIPMSENVGFAKGNNIGIRYAVTHFSPEFIVIMNPDVQIKRSGTIERLISTVKRAGNDVVGAQPIVHHLRSNARPTESVQVRRIPTVTDLVIDSSVFLRVVFHARFQKFLMMEAVPYSGTLKFLVPSGAFFIMRTAAFAALRYFDEGTFLFGEEFILGERLRRAGKCLILDANEAVEHTQGVSTQDNRSQPPNRKMHRIKAQSEIYFAREYLGANTVQCLVISCAQEIGYCLKLLLWLVCRGGRVTVSTEEV